IDDIQERVSESDRVAGDHLEFA
ncbi:MAG: hypothetical protein QOH44_1516, partial [Actinomycetota bacterium]|nr:hypothetical protein [Actinomycetota bacterium]